MNKALHRFALFTAFSTFFLIIAGGMVTSTGSGLAVPDWPLSYGQVMPPMVGGIFYEHGHRMIATFVGFLTVVLAIWLWRAESRRWVRNLGVIAVTAVLLQGALGGLTVIFLLPTPISVSHAALAQSFFCLVSAIALFTSPWWHRTSGGHGENTDPRVFKAALVLTGIVFLQLILGAVMRHTQSGLAIPDFPLSYGSLVPSLSPDAVASYNRIQLDENLRIAADGPLTAFQVFAHFAHRTWALVVTIAAVAAMLYVRAHSGHPRLRGLTAGIVLLVCIQVALGAFTVLSRKHELIATAHVAMGALTLVCSVLLALHAAKLAGVRVHRTADLPLPGEAPA